jgi:hypothetical protein
MTTRSDAHTKKPGERNSFLKPSIVVTDCSSGALSARMTDPMIQSVHPIHPYSPTSARSPQTSKQANKQTSSEIFGGGDALTKKVRLSLRKKCDKMAQITTDNAPIGVTRIASVNALS